MTILRRGCKGKSHAFGYGLVRKNWNYYLHSKVVKQLNCFVNHVLLVFDNFLSWSASFLQIFCYIERVKLKRRRLFVAKTELVRNGPNRTFLKSQVSRFVQKFFQVLATFIEGQRMLERKRPALIFALQSFILVLHSMPGSFENNLLSTILAISTILTRSGLPD